MTLHKIHRREVVLTELAVEAPDLATAIERAERGMRHRVVLESQDMVGFPPMVWAERVAEERAQLAHTAAIVAAHEHATEAVP